MKVRDVMTSPVVSIDPESSVLEAVRIMLQRHISGLPVIDKRGRLSGMITEGDFLRRAETGTQRRRPRWLEFLLGPGRTRRGIYALSWAQGSRDHDDQCCDGHRGGTAR